MKFDVDLAAFLIGILSLSGTVLGSYISLRVKIAEIGIKVDRSEKDINNLGSLIKQFNKELNI